MKTYVDLRKNVLSLEGLGADELDLIAKLEAEAAKNPDWNDYSNFWMATVHNFYVGRGLTAKQIMELIPYRIGRDLDSRIAIAQGWARMPDYRDEIETIIREKYRTRRGFAEATGISEDMLSHVLAKRKHLSIDALVTALDRIGYKLHIAPKSSS